MRTTLTKSELLNFYDNHLLMNFFKKSGKGTSVPYVIDAINEKLKHSKSPIKVLDVGCGSGHLLRFLRDIFEDRGVKNLQFYGIDCDPEMLKKAKGHENKDITYYHLDITQDVSPIAHERFDVVITINTFHEVYTQFLLNNLHLAEKARHQLAKKGTTEAFQAIFKLMKPQGVFVIYDGVEINKVFHTKTVDFRILNPELEANFPKIVKSYLLRDMKFEKTGPHTYRMNFLDFAHFTKVFKYFSTPLWPIESKQTYSYFSTRDFRTLFSTANFKLESCLHVNNDIGLWTANIEIMNPKMDFPLKAVLLSGIKMR